jgi:8-oxo-dGTP diphosphatase
MASCNKDCKCGAGCVRQDDHGGDCTCRLNREGHDGPRKLGHEFQPATEADFLVAYKKQVYPKPSVTVDMYIFTVLDGVLRVLLIERDGHPFKGHWVAPGGFLDVEEDPNDPSVQGEDLEEAAHRELEEETSLPRYSCYMEQLYTFGKAGRDPRTRVVSVAHLALVRSSLAPLVKPKSDAKDARWFSLEEIKAMDKPLGFDHALGLDMAIKRLRGKIDYAPIAFDLVPETFTVGDLRLVYEAVKGETYDPNNFHRRFKRMITDGVIVKAPGKRASSTRTAAVYRFVR